MPFNCGISMFELFPDWRHRSKGIQHYHCLQGHGGLLWGRDHDPAAWGGGAVLTRWKILPVLQGRHEDRDASCGPLGL